MIGDSFAYAKDAVIGKWMQWILLLVATLILAIPLLGYLVKVLRGEKPAPEVTGWGTLFIDGIKLLIISLIWAIPGLSIFFVFFGSMIGGWLMESNPAAMVAAFTGAIVYLLLLVVVAIITGLLSIIGAVRFARTGSIGEAFNFGAILDTIGNRVGHLYHRAHRPDHRPDCHQHPPLHHRHGPGAGRHHPVCPLCPDLHLRVPVHLPDLRCGWCVNRFIHSFFSAPCEKEMRFTRKK